MRIINVRVDETLFKKMKKEKEQYQFPNWEEYIAYLFGIKKKEVKA